MMKKFALLLILILVLPLSLNAEVTPVKNTVSNGVKEYKLDNGLKVLIIEDHKAPLATFQIWYRVGSRNEPIGKTGISHFLEHMMFKGTEKYGLNQFSNIIQRNGGINNAFTTRDYTMYFQTLPSDRISISIELEADRMRNLLIDPMEVTNERNVVMEERRTRVEDDPQGSLYEAVIATAFKAHPYRWHILGWMSDIVSIEREDLYDYYRTYYSPDNAFIVISGDVKADTVISAIREKFEVIPSGNKKPVTVKAKEPEQMGERRVYLKKEAALPYILMAYHVPSFPHEDSSAFAVLSSILSSGKSSRLYKNIVHDKRLAINSFTSYSGLYNNDPFLFVFGATTAPEKDIEDLEKAIYDEIERIKKELPSDREVQKAKNQIEASFIMGQDSIYFQALATGMFEMLGSWKLKEQYLENIRKTTREDVSMAAKKYLHEDNRTVGILIPIQNETPVPTVRHKGE